MENTKPLAVGDKVLLKPWKGFVNGLDFDYANGHRHAHAGKVYEIYEVCSDGDLIVRPDRNHNLIRWAAGYFERVEVALATGSSEPIFKDWSQMTNAVIIAHQANGGMWQFKDSAGAQPNTNYRRLAVQSEGIKGWHCVTADSSEPVIWLVDTKHKIQLHCPVDAKGQPVAWENLTAAPAPGQANVQATPKAVQLKQENTMSAASTTTVPTNAKPTRARHAFDEAKKRVPVAWTLDEAHDLIVQWAGSTVKVKAHKPVVKAWLSEQLQTNYGKAVIGAVIASPVGVPLLAHLAGRGEDLANRIADEFAAHSMTIAGVQLAKDVVRLVPKGVMKFATAMFDRFERSVEVKELGTGNTEKLDLGQKAAVGSTTVG